MELRPLDNRVAETVLVGDHESGLRVTMVPKASYSKTFGVFAANYGSVDNCLIDPADERRMTVPDGVAHFLEHKMFDDEKGDVSERFSALGAACNASTGFATTSYIFSATQNVAACVELLLDFVQSAYFTAESVAKEQGIIGQEIRMYQDDPSWRIFFNLLAVLYRSHPVRISIAGTEESIARIDPDVLYACHRAFYRPGNMALTLVGGMDPEALLELVDRDLTARALVAGGRYQRSAADDGPVLKREIIEEMDVARPKVLIGFKDRAIGGRGIDVARRELLSSMVLDLLFGRSSQAHEEFYRDGLIDDSFMADYTGDFGFGFATLGGDTDQPDLLEERLLERVAAFRAAGVVAADFERVRNKFMGKFVGMFDSLEAIAYSFSAGTFRGMTPFEVLAILERLTPEEVAERAGDLFSDDLRARSIVLPRTVVETQ